MNYFFKYIYRIAQIAVCLVLLIQLSGCDRGLVSGGEGTLILDFGAESDKVTVKGATAPATKASLVYTLDTVDQKGDTVAHFPDHRSARYIRLVEGTYTIYAEDNSPTSTDIFGEPRFGGNKDVVIKAGENTPVTINCRLINVKVTVETFSQEIRDNFTDYSLTIKPTLDSKDSVIFRQGDVDNGQVGWVNQTRKGTFVLIFRARNQQSPEKLQEYIRTIADAQPADFYRFNFTIDPVGGSSDGGALFRLFVRTDLNEYTFPLGVKDQTRPVPVVTRRDGGTIREPMTTNVVTRDGKPIIEIHAEAGIQRLRIRHTDPAVLLKYGLPGMITLGGDNTQAEDEAQRQQVAGVVTWSDRRLVGEIDTWVDFSGLVNTTRFNGELLPDGIYPMDIEIYDFDNQMVTQTVSVAVMPDMDFTVYSVPKNGAWATFVDLEGQWLTLSQPEHITFEYAVDGTEQWTRVPETDVVVSGKDISTHVKGLLPATTYKYRLVGENVKTSDSKTFTTDEAVQIPNLNFDLGYSKNTGSGMAAASDVWSPNIQGQSEFWGTGNAGTKNSNAFNENMTRQVSGDKAYAGNALRLESRYLYKNVVIMTVETFAAGSVYSGSFQELSGIPSTDAEVQKTYVHYGQPYTGRPIHLNGWYAYKSKPITQKGFGNVTHPDLLGQPDKCKIYISLEDWGKTTQRPKIPKVVGYGEFTSSETTINPEDESAITYKSFGITISYNTLTDRPTHIVMGATSSYMSDDFCGGEGSVLYIDEFELIWE